MKKSYFTFILVLFTLILVGQQPSNSVRIKEIAGKYDGETKKGLAHGHGTATGLDTYTGQFSKGLPEGEGTYTYSNGTIYTGDFSKGVMNGKGVLTYKKASGDSIVEGFWEAGEYVGKSIVSPFDIVNKTGSVNPNIVRQGDGNKIELVVLDPFNKYITPQVMVVGEFTQQNYYSRMLYADAKFPISFDIRYSCPNKFNSAVIDNTIRIKINKPGAWSITLKN